MRPLLAVLLAGTAFAAEAPDAGVDALKKDLGAYATRVLETAKVVKVTETPADSVRNWGKDQNEDFAKRLWLAVLEGLDSHSTEEKECKFQPQVEFQFQLENGTDHVDLRIDFTCQRLEFEALDPKAAEPRSAHRYFNASRAALVRLAQEAFPDDAGVKALKAWTWQPDAEAAKAAGAHAVKVLLAADSVEVWRIKSRKGDPAAKERQVAGGYPVISQGPDRGPAFAARIATLLLSGRTTAGFEKECKFSPGVVFTVKSGADKVDLILCFTCDELQALSLPPKAPEPVNGSFDMESARAGWIELARQGLPGDEEIQKLKSK